MYSGTPLPFQAARGVRVVGRRAGAHGAALLLARAVFLEPRLSFGTPPLLGTPTLFMVPHSIFGTTPLFLEPHLYFWNPASTDEPSQAARGVRRVGGGAGAHGAALVLARALRGCGARRAAVQPGAARAETAAGEGEVQ